MLHLAISSVQIKKPLILEKSLLWNSGNTILNFRNLKNIPKPYRYLSFSRESSAYRNDGTDVSRYNFVFFKDNFPYLSLQTNRDAVLRFAGDTILYYKGNRGPGQNQK